MKAPGDTSVYIAGSKTVNDWKAFRARLASGGDTNRWREAFDDYFHARLLLRYLNPIKYCRKTAHSRERGFQSLRSIAR
jgi:hypothetical protein